MVNQWGGKRTGSGRPARWKSGDTVAVRIPEKFRDEVIAFARLLDEGESSLELFSCSLPESLENVQKVKNIRKLVTDWTRKASRTSNPKWYHAKKLLNELRDVLQI